MTRNEKSIVTSLVIGVGFIMGGVASSPYFFIGAACCFAYSGVRCCFYRDVEVQPQAPVEVPDESPPLPPSVPSFTEQPGLTRPPINPAAELNHSTLNDTKHLNETMVEPIEEPGAPISPSVKSPMRVTWVFDRVGIVVEPAAPTPPGSIQYETPVERFTVRIKTLGARK